MTAPASAVAGVAVKLRDPYPPHRAILSAKVAAFPYGFMLMRPATAQFAVSRADTTAPYAWAVGNMISIERSDGLLPWWGYITDREMDSDSGTALLTATDLAGSLFAQAEMPKDWPTLKRAAGEWVRTLFVAAGHSSRPPLLVDVRFATGGGPVEFAPSSGTALDLLDTMAAAADWEWRVVADRIGTPFRRATLEFAQRLGRDLSKQIVFEEGRHFARARLTESTEGLLETVTTLGGSGPVADRPAVSVNAQSWGQPSVSGARLTGAKSGLSPASAGARVVIEPRVTNKEALAKIGQREHHSPDAVSEAFSFTIAETETSMDMLEVGSLYGVRFADLSLGLAVHRVVRLVGLQLSPDGQHDLECVEVRQSGEFRRAA